MEEHSVTNINGYGTQPRNRKYGAWWIKGFLLFIYVLNVCSTHDGGTKCPKFEKAKKIGFYVRIVWLWADEHDIGY